jgi:hypothetical protein
MPYIRRSPEGDIVALLNEAAPDAGEFLPATAPEVCRFLGTATTDSFNGLDFDFIRVMEDLIDVMLDKGLLRLTDLPAEAQRKLLARKDMRRQMQGALRLLDDDDVI